MIWGGVFWEKLTFLKNGLFWARWHAWHKHVSCGAADSSVEPGNMNLLPIVRNTCLIRCYYQQRWSRWPALNFIVAQAFLMRCYWCENCPSLWAELDRLHGRGLKADPKPGHFWDTSSERCGWWYYQKRFTVKEQKGLKILVTLLQYKFGLHFYGIFI